MNRRKWLGWCAVGAVGAGVALVSAACGDDDVTATPVAADGSVPNEAATTNDAASSSDGGFVIGANGGTETLTLPNGQVLVFTFPASAAGKRVSLRVIDGAAIGHPGELPNLIELLPHGTTFDPPVRVEPLLGSASGFIGTFSDAANPDAFELLQSSADGLALDLPHFSYLGMVTPQVFCSGGTFTDVTTTTGPCCPGGVQHTWQCVRTSANCITTTVSTPSCVGSTATTPVCYVAPPLQRTGSVCGIDGGTDAASDAPSDAPNDVATDAPADASDAASADAGDGSTSDAGSIPADAGGSVDGAVGAAGCPDTGVYTVTATGTCGDLNTNASRQRIDGSTGCFRYFEYDGNLGVGSASYDFASSGTQASVPMTLGSSSVTCDGTTTTGSVSFTCSNGCSISMLRYGPL